MGEAWAIAGSVWRRILGMKVVYFLVLCAVIQVAVTLLYKWLMALEHRMLMVDMAHFMTTLAGLLCVLALCFDIPAELREGGAAALLSKPLGRPQYLLGKYLGIVIVALVITLLISTGFCVIYRLAFGTLPASAVAAQALAVASVIPMAAIGLFWAALLREAPAAIMTAVSVWLLYSTPLLIEVPVVYGGILPDLNLYNMRAQAAHNIGLDAAYVVLVAVWGIVYSIGLVSFTGILFNRRDLG